MRYIETDLRWSRALGRAVEEHLRSYKLLFPLERSMAAVSQADGLDVYYVESSRHDGSYYLVELHRGKQTVSAICSCKAGQTKMPCKHAALALAKAGIYTQPVPVERDRKEVAA